MKNPTRALYNAYLSQVAKLNGVDDATTKFTVSPAVQQTLETRMQESSQFLTSINVNLVTDQEGEKVGLGIGGTIAGRTDTNAKDRETRDVGSLDSNKYRAEKTDSDTHVRYATLDAWARFADFQTRLRDAILKRQALDRITIGFNGTSVAATTDRAANPLLQDVNIGWLEQYRRQAAQRVMSHGAAVGSKIKVGAAGDYENLDALVFDMVNNLLDPWHQEDTELVAICGRGMLHDKYFPLLNKAQDPTEQIAADLIVSQKRIGGLAAVRVPYFPANAVMVTRLDNLSIYVQEGSRRRSVIDNPKRDRIENFESSNEAYVVEDFGCGAVAENIEIVQA